MSQLDEWLDLFISLIVALHSKCSLKVDGFLRCEHVDHMLDSKVPLTGISMLQCYTGILAFLSWMVDRPRVSYSLDTLTACRCGLVGGILILSMLILLQEAKAMLENVGKQE